ncbi:MAG: AarF/ABC1/UbiB kinase family protein [Parcubacteria group bacterium]|nr:AarF/ABC1/UbiB kinase family protein [Parcubacteria group bacterium]
MNNAFRHQLRRLGTGGRFVEICLVLARHIFRASSTPKYFRNVVEDLGGGIIKLAQILAMRYDLLPSQYCRELAGLFEDVRPLSEKDIRRVFAEEFGKRPEEIFDKFSHLPVASASFGQVHKAELDGHAVAIKIQRPEAAALSEMDIRIIKALAFIINPLHLTPSMSVKDIVREWEQWTRKELNYIQEGVNADRLRTLDASPDICIPKIFWRYTTRRVLCEEFLTGRSINKLMTDGSLSPKDKTELARRIIMAPFRQYFLHGFTHADLHPGNMFLLEDGRLGIVDFGIMSEAVSTRRPFAQFIWEALSGDFSSSLQCFFRFMENGFLGPQAEYALRDIKLPHGLSYKKIEKYALRVLERQFSGIMVNWMDSSANSNMHIREKSSARYFLDLLFFAGKYGMIAPHNIVSFIRTLVIVDMVCLVIDPNFDMAGIAKEFFAAHPEIFQPSAEEVRAENKMRTLSLALPAIAPWEKGERAQEAWSLFEERRRERRIRLQERYLEQASRALEKILEQGSRGLAGFASGFSSRQAV